MSKTTTEHIDCSKPKAKRKRSPKATSLKTSTSSQFVSPSLPLSQADLVKWWPFTRLDPKKFPKPTYEDAPL